MELPDLRDYGLESEITSTTGRLVTLSFSKIEPEAERWRQMRLTLVGARLSMASLEIVQGFPPLRSCEASEKTTAHGRRIQLSLSTLRWAKFPSNVKTSCGRSSREK
jgi:hypothetical protein